MTGMLLSGADPIEAASIQIVIFAAIIAAGFMASSLLLHYSTESFLRKRPSSGKTWIKYPRKKNISQSPDSNRNEIALQAIA